MNTTKFTDEVHVAGHWEIGYMTPIMEANYWNLVLRDFKVKHWHMTPISGILHNETQTINLTEYHSYDDLFAAIPSKLSRVFLEPRSAQTPSTTWLHEFKHPQNCIYVFGSAHYNPTLNHFRPSKDHIVSIKTLEDKGVLWSNQCLAITLYDRMMKTK